LKGKSGIMPLKKPKGKPLTKEQKKTEQRNIFSEGLLLNMPLEIQNEPELLSPNSDITNNSLKIKSCYLHVVYIISEFL